MEYTIDNLKQLRESEDHIEFKAARLSLRKDVVAFLDML